jgi:hypothetical protein
MEHQRSKLPTNITWTVLLLLFTCIISGCVTGFDGEEFSKAIKGIEELNARTDRIKEAEFRRKQEAFYDMQLKNQNQ